MNIIPNAQNTAEGPIKQNVARLRSTMRDFGGADAHCVEWNLSLTVPQCLVVPVQSLAKGEQA